MNLFINNLFYTKLESHHSRFFLKIHDGCSQFYTFCIILFARRKSQSLSTNSLIESILQAHANGIAGLVSWNQNTKKIKAQTKKLV